MSKTVKVVVLSVAGVLAALVALAAFVAATFDPNQYKPQIVEAVKARTGRTLRLDGDIALAFFPAVGARIGKAALSEQDSEREFAAVESLRVSVKLLPLLSRQVVVDAVEVTGLRANLVRDKAGRTNVEDLAGAPAAAEEKAAPREAAPVRIDIDHVAIENASLVYHDAQTGAKYALSRLNVRTGRIAPGVPTDLQLSVAASAEQPKLAVETTLKTRLAYDLGERIYKLDNIDLSVKGDAAGISGLNATGKGGLEVRAATGEIVANGLALAATGRQAGGDLNVRLGVPRLALTRERVAGEKITLDATVSEAKRKLVAKLAVAGVEGRFQAFRAGPLEAQVDMQGDGRTVRAKLTGALAGDLEGRRFELPKFAAQVTVNDPGLPKSPIDATVTGAARADLGKETASFEFATRLDDSNVNGRAGATRFSPLALTFEVNVDQLDADRYMAKGGQPPAGGGGTTAPAGKGGAPAPAGGAEDKIDLSALKGVNLAGTVKIGSLKVKNVRSTQVRADVKIANGRLDVAPLAAQLYQGTLSGALSAQAAANPVFAVRQNLAGVSLGPLLRDAANIDLIEGRGNLALDITTRGATASALKKALAGTAALNVADGALKGIDIAGTIRGAREKLRELRGLQTQPSSKSHKTDFTELRATFNLKNGVARNDDLSMKSPLLRIAGEGAIDIGNDTIDYLVKATAVATAGGQGGKDLAQLQGVTVPVRLVGPLGAPQYAVDFEAVALELAKQRLQERLLKPVPGSSGGSLRDQLKGLLGR